MTSEGQHMNASDIMVSNVISIGPDATVRDAAKLLGIISEGDLLRRSEVGTEKHRSWWLELLSSNEGLAAEFVRSHARKVSDLMTRSVVVAKPDTSLADIATLMEKNDVKRIPIMKDGKVIGIVSRANLVQALASAPNGIGAQPKVDDAVVRERVQGQLTAQAWTRPSRLNVIVHDGTVELWGIVDSQVEKKAARVAAEEVPGVVAIRDNLIVMPVVSGY